MPQASHSCKRTRDLLWTVIHHPKVCEPCQVHFPVTHGERDRQNAFHITIKKAIERRDYAERFHAFPLPRKSASDRTISENYVQRFDTMILES
jgi:hypothetical protein